jgi:hypothetical protein
MLHNDLLLSRALAVALCPTLRSCPIATNRMWCFTVSGNPELEYPIHVEAGSFARIVWVGFTMPHTPLWLMAMYTSHMFQLEFYFIGPTVQATFVAWSCRASSDPLGRVTDKQLYMSLKRVLFWLLVNHRPLSRLVVQWRGGLNGGVACDRYLAPKDQPFFVIYLNRVTRDSVILNGFRRPFKRV